ncbi:acetylglutamate kinase [Bacillus sp. FJAT-50079]|uniref:acetylglutamate kinase n=1 Tax=Bacillus sp. FJAT-50079 TaxID=2833577 RepID=UPI001BCA4868|nr:acetylglutamate kinase [Bacillus sp. FJAT-50079]MBS4207404.1 acetylglutamate kinase [Bacillus sp. FJAT-50079]
MGGIVVIKCGGSMIESLTDDFYDSIKQMQSLGYKPVIVHGGGPAINKMLNDLNIESEFVNGLRKTTNEVMDVVEMVLTGSIANQLVRTLQQKDISAIGINGADGGLLQAKAKDRDQLGYVGEITTINQQLILQLLALDFIPVISPIASGVDGEHCYNINADTAAGEIAVAVGAEKLLFVTDVPGVLKDGKIIEKTTKNELLALIDSGVIYGGMIPKVMAAIHGLDGGMAEAVIVSGTAPLLDGENIVGTMIRKEVEVVL